MRYEWTVSFKNLFRNPFCLRLVSLEKLKEIDSFFFHPFVVFPLFWLQLTISPLLRYTIHWKVSHWIHFYQAKTIRTDLYTSTRCPCAKISIASFCQFHPIFRSFIINWVHDCDREYQLFSPFFNSAWPSTLRFEAIIKIATEVCGWNNIFVLETEKYSSQTKMGNIVSWQS